MDYEKLDLKLVKKAKEAAAGPLGKEMAKFPLRFAKPVFFGDRPTKGKLQNVNSGTAVLLNLNGKLIALTCSHVLDSYRKIHGNPNTNFQIGDLELNPLDKIIDESGSSSLDLVTIDLQGLSLRELQNDKGIGSFFFTPARWPPEGVKQGDFVAFGGFPGVWRQNLSWHEIQFDSWSSGGTEVSSVSEDHFVCQFEREFWVETFNLRGRDGLDLRNLGGLSGSPVFIHRSIYLELVGIVYEFSESLDLMYTRPVRFIREDGTIEKTSS
jgi:hypothetical protein